VRVAALYDIHGNTVALRAVLAEVEREDVDLILIGGDAVPGPLPQETIELLRALGDRAVFVCGNTDRWVVEAFDDEQPVERPAATWTATQIDRGQRDFLASFGEPRVIDVDGLGDINAGSVGMPGIDDFLRGSLFEPADPLVVAESLERQAQDA
jgi:hypothetical protein